MNQESRPNSDATKSETAADSGPGDAGDAPRQLGVVAGPLRMTGAGLLVGLVVCLILESAFPFFPVPETSASRSAGPPGDAALAEMAAVRTVTKLKNAAVAGLILGALAGFVFAVTEGVSRPGVLRSVLGVGLAIALGAGCGTLAGYVAQSFHLAYEHDRSMDSMLRVGVTQVFFWTVTAGGIGLGVGLFTGRFRLVFGSLIQAVFGAVLFVIVYVPVASLLFPLDDAEQIFPASAGNMCAWSIGAFGLMGLLLGLARQGSKATSDGDSDQRLQSAAPQDS